MVPIGSQWAMCVFCAVPCHVHWQLVDHVCVLCSTLWCPSTTTCQWWTHSRACISVSSQSSWPWGLPSRSVASPGISLWLTVTCFTWNFTVDYSYLIHLELHCGLHLLAVSPAAFLEFLFHLELCRGLELLVISLGTLPWLSFTYYFTWNFAVA